MRPLLVVLTALMLMAGAASDPSERLQDPAQEARARTLFAEIRCLVCQNESIDDSDAELAGDLRKVVREQITAGRSDGEVKAFLTDRYGEFVLLKPRFNPANAVLWLGPFLAALAGLALLASRFRRREATPALSGEEETRLAALLDDETA
ncbi:MAG: cytochrome c-type biogenesis protein [Caulobacter sp.]